MRKLFSSSCRTIIAIVLGMAMLSAATGCGEGNSRALTEAPPAAALPESPWRIDEVNGKRSARVEITHEDVLEQLAAAIEQARNTADEAREHWRKAPESQQHRWAVKWAAPVVGDDDAVEHLWVRPRHWSRFRIEGELLNEPDRPLDAPVDTPGRGDIVSFPAKELSDWVRWHDDDPAGRRDGGFTIEVVERTAGTVRGL